MSQQYPNPLACTKATAHRYKLLPLRRITFESIVSLVRRKTWDFPTLEKRPRLDNLFVCLKKESANMQNDEGLNTDLYIPRKCSATNRLITSKDHASVQINVGHLDENGVYSSHISTFALCGYVRAQGDADSAIDRLWQKKKVEVKQQ